MSRHVRFAGPRSSRHQTTGPPDRPPAVRGALWQRDMMETRCRVRFGRLEFGCGSEDIQANVPLNNGWRGKPRRQLPKKN
ncbi:Hypothetical protein SMAX5B_016068 [Scophthalmus maximus]|uniref:Uncharacterized protein n=1 Tax=Scophthalmus maximus TaxID=52904 RepID=A0A2U9CU60_SCOMX|nr:Hypothetical protein SMAX5B_016068 [Scophthalmus maximus]